ncbi:L-threonylcarbamoyladenylate synthase [Roseburia sp. AM59-24XD]|jgi:L-threonylcarbamoyladenylate synthase|uniref:L-threonylcarbamoyladenylate synthase n=1 Tax=Roseburia sp. AM59-24XD TaxID=2293138 RepID=UPI000E4D3304|nr:L-threonylcarbamoyladenylate synthase [Roseburia sp. AM59-24XD]RHP81207.1 threonylcarbamoyl-AMP synthase [Roseburia sp. AM59-24XD]
MKTIMQTINPESFRDEELEEACRILQKGGLVAFPTETVYGLGGDAMYSEASAKIYAAKGRPSDNPLIVHIADMDALEDIAQSVPEAAVKLADHFWPGPLTMIFPKKEAVPKSTTGGLETVAVRMPSHPVARALIRESGVYIAAPSANTSGRPSPTKAEHVKEDLDGRIDMILDGGAVGIGLESTIVDLSTGVPTILRPGYITGEMLEDVLGEVQVDPAILSQKMNPNIVAKAPGMKYRHYAPKGQMTIIEGDTGKVVDEINRLVKEKTDEGCSVAVIATEETKDAYACANVRSVGSRATEGSIAAGLYDILREMDHIGAEYIYAESFEKDTLGKAIMNRMLKAAAYHVIKV